MGQAAQPVIDKVNANLPNAVKRLFALLEIPSISTDPAYNDQTRQAAQFMVDDLASIGFDTKLHDTDGHPMVTAHYPGPDKDNVPHVLYYGHYDVQPPDPLNLWNSPPFEPTLVDSEHGKSIVARGAVDDKGQLMTFVEAFRAWMAVHGSLPIRVTILLEGEEESGSPSLDPFLEANKQMLTADTCIVCDTGMWDVKTPAITYMLRGLVYTEVTLKGPSHDLHSGMYGGAVVNPINALTRVLSQLHNDDGVVQIPGFYDDVLPLSEEEIKQWEQLGFDETEFLATAGYKEPFGEKGHSTLERMWSRPTCDINGIWGGYTGAGAKTVIGAQVSTKVSCRLVANQDPDKIFESLKQFFQQRTPPGCKWEIQSHGISPAIRVPTDSPYLQAAMKGLSETYSKDAVLIGTGGSIPLVGSIQKILGFDSLLIGFGLDDDRVHSPNEKFEMRCFEMGIKSHVAILEQLAAVSS
ncbi:MAG: dipeptidase [Planctomycetes bacterium]|nr:dipeptidase [Planctomycetota bacterium]